MRSHILAQRATTKYFSNSFIFKTNVEKEGLPRDSPVGCQAGALPYNENAGFPGYPLVA